ncbi:MAG: homoserine dehydrogenase [Pseudomonadota bacterium]
MKTVRVGICGLGTVGGGVFKLLTQHAPDIADRAGCHIEVARIGARRDREDCPTGTVPVHRDIMEVADADDVDILVELIGGTDIALDLVRRAINRGKHVVTANKALIAEHGNELFAEAAAAGVSIAYEAAVAGGIPIIKALREGLTANRVQWLAGIINGTSNFILTEMRDKGRDFADVLAEAQALGFAEADPTFDVEGIDAAHKLVIMASIAFGMPLEFDKVYTEGIGALETVDVSHAAALGYRIKHLGIARRAELGIELRVHPTLVPEKRLLANVDGVKNAVLVEGDAVGPTLYYGAGAGELPTASAVIADLVDIARDLALGQRPAVADLGVRAEAVARQPIVSIEDVKSAWYLRLLAADKPGVLSEVTAICGRAGVSIEALTQKEPAAGQTLAEVIMITNRAPERDLAAVLDDIAALEDVEGPITRIRIEALDG